MFLTPKYTFSTAFLSICDCPIPIIWFGALNLRYLPDLPLWPGIGLLWAILSHQVVEERYLFKKRQLLSPTLSLSLHFSNNLIFTCFVTGGCGVVAYNICQNLELLVSPSPSACQSTLGTGLWADSFWEIQSSIVESSIEIQSSIVSNLGQK